MRILGEARKEWSHRCWNAPPVEDVHDLVGRAGRYQRISSEALQDGVRIGDRQRPVSERIRSQGARRSAGARTPVLKCVQGARCGGSDANGQKREAVHSGKCALSTRKAIRCAFSSTRATSVFHADADGLSPRIRVCAATSIALRVDGVVSLRTEWTCDSRTKSTPLRAFDVIRCGEANTFRVPVLWRAAGNRACTLSARCHAIAAASAFRVTPIAIEPRSARRNER